MDDDPRQWIAAVCRRAREAAGLNRTVVAGALNQSEDVIRRFETLRGKWSPGTGEIVAAYANATGIPAPDLWQMAIDQWKAADQRQAEGAAAPPHSPRIPAAPASSQRGRSASDATPKRRAD